MNTDQTQTQKIVRYLVRANPWLFRILHSVRDRRTDLLSCVSQRLFYRGFSRQDLDRLAEAKKAIAQVVALF